MSTQINVTVGSGGLPDKAKQQQQAARQAQLEKERQRRIEAEGADKRNARLAAEGRNAQGQPLAGTPNLGLRPQDEPAAFRSAQDIFSFYTTPDIDSATIYTSGDGLQSVKPETRILPDPLPSLPALTTNVNPPGTTLPQINNLGEGIVGSIFNGAELVESEYKFRPIFNSNRSIQRTFPLGNGTALAVIFNQIGRCSQIVRHYYNQSVGPNYAGSIEIETPWTFAYSYTACIVGQNVAVEATLPEAAINTFKAVLTENTNDFYATFGQYTTNPAFTPQTSLLPSDLLPVRSGTVSIQLGAYGLVDRYRGGTGAYMSTVSATPLNWFYLDQDYLNSASIDLSTLTHEQIYAASIGGPSPTSIASLFLPSQMLSIDPVYLYPDWPASKFSDAGTTKSWRAGPLTGRALTLAELSTYNPANWWNGKKFKGSATSVSGLNANRHFIHDWGQRSFCIAQASRYGLSSSDLLP